MKTRLFDRWAARQRPRQCSQDEPHPTLWAVLALVAALLGVLAAVSRNADDEPKLALAQQARGWLESVATTGPAPHR